MDDVKKLIDLNLRFIDAFRMGSWLVLRPILAHDFAYLDGATGDVRTLERYVADLEGRPLATIEIDQVRVHVAGDVAVVSARSSTRPGRFKPLRRHLRAARRPLALRARLRLAHPPALRPPGPSPVGVLSSRPMQPSRILSGNGEQSRGSVHTVDGRTHPLSQSCPHSTRW